MKRRMAVTLILMLVFTLFAPNLVGNQITNQRGQFAEYNEAQVFHAAKILFDESHCARGSDMWTPGNASVFSALLEAHGYESSTNWAASLDSGILTNFDILCLFFPQVALSSGEVTAVHNFVESGGGLLVVGIDVGPDWAYTPEHLNPVSEPYGITFNIDRWLGRCIMEDGDLIEHDLTYDVASIHSSCDQMRGCTLTVTSPATAIGSFKGSPTVAYSTAGAGRVFASGALAPFIQYRHDSGWRVDWDDHYQFSLNTIDWLAGNAPRIVSVPDKIVIRTGSGPALTPSEIEDYEIFNGVYHDHTTRSDGEDNPDIMVNRALETALDFFLVADHSYDSASNNGIFGGLISKAYQEKYGLDCQIFIGAELSSIPHTVGFPLTENIFTDDITEAVNGIHSQGAISVLAHPTIGFAYIDPWIKFDMYGYDAFEVDCRAYFHALGESCYFRPFIASNDGHAYRNHGLIRNVVFVKNPTGPNGTISAEDLKEAVLDYRVVVLDLVNKVILGRSVWVDRLLEVLDQAEAAVDDCNTQLGLIHEEPGWLCLSRAYVSAAETALEWWNPSRALRLAEEGLSDFSLGIYIRISRNLGVNNPGDTLQFSAAISNSNPYPVKLNVTPFIVKSLTLEKNPIIVELDSGTNQTIDLIFNTTSFGYTAICFNFQCSNATETHMALTYTVGGIIDNIDVQVDNSKGEITIRLLRNRDDYRMITSAVLHSNNGSGTVGTAMKNFGDSYGLVLGPFQTNVSISFYITIIDVLGSTFRLEGETYDVLGSGIPELPGEPIDLVLSAIIGGTLVVVLAAVLFIAKRRKTH
ncbi:MAG: hypothetical protein ACFFEK_13665 [Candidatus Thorarchaeota archaeon]